MFIYQSQLRHLLRPEDYFDPKLYELELERLFRPGWHFLASTAELSRNGAFLTRELLGQPVLLRNFDGQIQAFLNVCAHRHCRLTHEAHGWSPQLRCQYHGWEYTRDGRTARIPDARCFRPFDRENARLRKFRTETCGQLVFVSLEDEGPSLAEYLGSFHEECARWYAPPFGQAWTWQTDYAANWKTVTENSLESYHIPCLHQKSFGRLPLEEECQHDLTPQYTTFRTPEMFSWISVIQNWMVRTLGQRTTNVYTHHHMHPNLIFINMDVMRMAQLIVPTSATTTRHHMWVFTLRGSPKNPWAWMIGKILSMIVVKVARQVVMEDAPIFAEIQKGLQASVHPGVLGTREERVYVFQKYLMEAYGRDVENGEAEKE